MGAYFGGLFVAVAVVVAGGWVRKAIDRQTDAVTGVMVAIQHARWN